MKKLISLTLALMLVFSLATVAMANTEPTGPYNGKLDQPTSFTKKYLVNNVKLNLLASRRRGYVRVCSYILLYMYIV